MRINFLIKYMTNSVSRSWTKQIKGKRHTELLSQNILQIMINFVEKCSIKFVAELVVHSHLSDYSPFRSAVDFL